MLRGVTGSTAAAQATIKRAVLDHLGDNGYYQGLRIVAEFSDQTICYRPGGRWEFAFMEVKQDGEQPTTQAVMSRPLNGFRFPIKDGESALDEAYEGEGNCVIRQLAALYAPYDEIEREMQEIGDIRDGVPATFALEWCKRHRIARCVVWDDTLATKRNPEGRAHVTSCALTIVGGHAVIHKCSKSLAHMRVGEAYPLAETTR